MTVALGSTSPHPSHGAARGGPPLAPVAIAFTALFVTGLIASGLMAGRAFPSPFGDAASIRSYVTDEGDAIRLSAVFQFAAAVPLAVLAAAVHARLDRLGIRAAASTIALSGGLLASTFAVLSALVTWTLSRPAVTGDPALVRLLHDLAFLTGGPATVVALGLLFAGIAVPALLVGLLPRWLAVTGLVLAVVAELAILTLLAPGFGVLLPLARFGGMAWLITAGALLPVSRPSRQATDPA